ncbi:MAG: 50S ribosomal protein L24 [Flavobacteriales bacterium]|nr:50S ribosomal protein L24 [Flavobacteriales bacterium]
MFKRYKVKKGDLVVVTTGDNKGKQGRIVEVDRKNDRVIVEGVNLVKKHRKPSAQNPQGGIETIAAGINISNVKLVDNKGNATRVGRRRNAEGKLERYSKKSGETIK